MLKQPAILSRIQSAHLNAVSPDDLVPEFLQTIRVPDNLKHLKDSLPKPNYAPLRLKNEEKEEFLKNLEQSYSRALKLRQVDQNGLGKLLDLKQRTSSLNNSESNQNYGPSTKENGLPNVYRSVSDIPGAKNSLLKNSLPNLSRKPISNLELKLKFLNKKKFEDLYQKESIGLSVEPKNAVLPNEALVQRYDSILGHLKQ